MLHIINIYTYACMHIFKLFIYSLIFFNVITSKNTLPFSVCSMICLMAFFRLLARSISCSRGLKIAAGGRGEQGAVTVGGAVGGARTTPSPSTCSSAMVGGGADITLLAWASSLSVFNNESNFSFSTPHCTQKHPELLISQSQSTPQQPITKQ